MTQHILELHNITKTFYATNETTEVLKGIDLNIAPGEFVTLLGPSGCGKTTLLRIIAGLETTDSGEVRLDGEEITNKEPHLRDVNMVFQNYALFPHMTVEENIGYGLKIKKVDKTEIKKRVTEMLSLVQLEGYEKRSPEKLSGGQRQRVAIARALINQPKVLLLDEPLGALDLKLRRQMQIELKQLQKRLGITFIYITHDQEEAINMSDRIAVMNQGVFEQIGTPNEIYYQPKTSYVASFVGDANLLRLQGKLYAVRTENVCMSEEACCTYMAKVKEKSFAGGRLRIVFSLEDGQEVIASRFGIDYGVQVGETVKIGWEEAHAIEVTENGR